MILCHIEAEPPIDFVTWTKNKRLFDPFETPGVMALKNGSLLIDKVSQLSWELQLMRKILFADIGEVRLL